MDARLLLRPGAPVLHRDPHVVQVGVDADAPRLPATDEVVALLEALCAPSGLASGDVDRLAPPAASALARLDDAGVLVRSGAPDPRRAARAALTVLLDAPPALADRAGMLLDAAGIATVRIAPAAGPGDPTGALVHLVVAAGVLDREALDPLVRDGVAHLVLSGGADGLRLGPLVVPGLTACLRCVDAHESLADPRRPLLLAQAARSPRTRETPRDVVLDDLALAWAVRDLALLAEGEEPSTWSSTVEVPATGQPTLTRWGRHPECGCCWDLLPDG